MSNELNASRSLACGQSARGASRDPYENSARDRRNWRNAYRAARVTPLRFGVRHAADAAASTRSNTESTSGGIALALDPNRRVRGFAADERAMADSSSLRISEVHRRRRESSARLTLERYREWGMRHVVTKDTVTSVFSLLMVFLAVLRSSDAEAARSLLALRVVHHARARRAGARLPRAPRVVSRESRAYRRGVARVRLPRLSRRVVRHQVEPHPPNLRRLAAVPRGVLRVGVAAQPSPRAGRPKLGPHHDPSLDVRLARARASRRAVLAAGHLLLRRRRETRGLSSLEPLRRAGRRRLRAGLLLHPQRVRRGRALRDHPALPARVDQGRTLESLFLAEEARIRGSGSPRANASSAPLAPGVVQETAAGAGPIVRAWNWSSAPCHSRNSGTRTSSGGTSAGPRRSSDGWTSRAAMDGGVIRHMELAHSRIRALISAC